MQNIVHLLQKDEDMNTKNIQLSGEDLVKKLTGIPFKSKGTRSGYPTTYADDLKLLHQLHVLQMEMELQNEPVHNDFITLDELNRKQRELFEFAPNGYFSINTEGNIEEANLTGALMLGLSSKQLMNQPFINYILPHDQDVFKVCWFNLMQTNDYQVFNVEMIRSDAHRLAVRMVLSCTKIKNEFYILAAITDVTMWKQVEETQSFLLSGKWVKSGIDFFHALTEYLGQSLEMDYVSVDKLINGNTEGESVAVYQSGHLPETQSYKIRDTVLGKMMESNSFCFPNNVRNLFPNDRLLQLLKAESYAGVVLKGLGGNPLGFISMIGSKPLMDPQLIEMILNQVSIRADVELENRQQEEAVRKMRDEIELQVQKRTSELEMINDQLLMEIEVVKKHEQSLKEAEAKYRTVADFTYNLETWISPAGEFIYVSPSCENISGYTAEEFMSNPSLSINMVHPDDRPMVEEHFSKELSGQVTNGLFDYRIITRDGEERWIGHHCQPVFDSGGTFMGQRSSNRDITQRKSAEKILLDSQKQLRLLSQRMDEITEAERTRIAREIHDELGHLLTALKYDMEAFINQSELSVEDLKSELEIMIDMVDSLIDSVRKIATDLRPGVLEHLGIFPAIEWQIKEFRLRTKICCVFSMEPMDVDFDKNETNIIFRILQEILTNIIRHSQAKHVTVLVAQREPNFILEVIDNGIGFNLDFNDKFNTLGILGMKERALSIGGEIHIHSQPGKGTKVQFTLPGKRNINQPAI